MSFRIGIDVGGTFTDFLVVGEGEELIHKTSSTPSDPSKGLLQGLAEIAEILGRSREDLLAETTAIVHGTTVATNALLTRRGARVGLIGTKGFRDMLAIRDGAKESNYDNDLQPPVPLVDRYLRMGITGRINAAGEEVEALSIEEIEQAVEHFRAEGVEAVALCLLHSPTNPEHERQASEALERLMPDVYKSVSVDLVPQIRYYDRLSTTVLNSYVGPIIANYLGRLEGQLRDAGFDGILLIMQSNGGVATPAEVAREAGRALLSGPASGPASGLAAVRVHGMDHCLSVDMGGTSFDAALVKGGKALVMSDGVIDRWRTALPMIDIHTIGAGGGSIARVDEGGLLHVGPDSAGAEPGPACYRRGGERATITDADLLLGYLDADSFLGGRMSLDLEAARRAISKDVAEPLGLEPELAASGIYNYGNVNMAAGIREVTVRRGLDSRDFPLVVAGGAGPVHAAAIASELEIPMLVVPRESSIFCAAGMLLSDFKHDFVVTMKRRLSEVAAEDLAGAWAEMTERGRATLEREGLDPTSGVLVPTLDMRYKGQWWELSVPLPESEVASPNLDAIAAAFHAEHDQHFGYSSPEMEIDLLNVRLQIVGETPKPHLGLRGEGSADAEDGYLRHRPVWSQLESGFLDTPVYDGTRLGAGAAMAGPAIIELPTTTIVVPEQYDVAVDDADSFVLRLKDRQPPAEEAGSALEAVATAAASDNKEVAER